MPGQPAVTASEVVAKAPLKEVPVVQTDVYEGGPWDDAVSTATASCAQGSAVAEACCDAGDGQIVRMDWDDVDSWLGSYWGYTWTDWACR